MKIMNRMVGIILMLVGSILLTAGTFIYIKSPDSSNKISSDAQPNISPSSNRNQEYSNQETFVLKEESQIYSAPSLNSKSNTLMSRSAESKVAILAEVSNENSNSESKSLGTAKSRSEIDEEKKSKGIDFEKYIVQKFNRKYFSIKEWTGDKYVNGLYAETTLQPDMVLEIKIKEQSKQFAVECKWKQRFYRNGVEVATNNQLVRYKEFEKNKGIPVFLTVGIDGDASAPKHLYVIPLKEIKNNFIPISDLKKYEKDAKDNFFFDLNSEVLQ